MENWYEHPLYIPDEVRALEEGEAAYALREAWFRIYGAYPSDESLAVLWAKSALETGRWKSIHCFNFGNIKRKEGDDQFFTMFQCGEEVSLSQALELVKEDPDRVKIVKQYSWSNGSKRASIMIHEGHLWSQFRAHKTAEDGAEDYILFVSKKKRYLKAWQKVIEGDPKGYAHELKVAGYYTAPEDVYTAGVVRLFNEFMRRKDELLSWKNDTDPSPPPPESEELNNIHDTDKDLVSHDEDDNDIDDIEVDIVDTTNKPESNRPTNQKRGVGLVAVIAGIGAIIAWVLQHL